MFKIFHQYKGLSRDIYILFIGRVVQAMGTFIWPMMTLILSAKFGYDAPKIALIMLIGGALQMPAQALGGKWADKYGRKNVLLISSYLMVSGYFLNAILPLGIHTIAIFFISGFFGSVTHPASHALIADKTSSVDRERAYSLSYLGFNLGFILGPSIGGFLFQNHLGLAFFIDGFTTLIGTVLIHIYIQDGLRKGEHIEIGEYEKEEHHQSIVQLFMNNKVLIYYVLIIAISEVMYMQVNFLLPLQLETIMTNYSEFYGILSSFNGLVVIIFTPLLTIWLSHTKEIKRFILGTLLYMITFILYGLFYQHWFIFILGMWIFTMGEVSYAITRGAYITRRIPATHRARVQGSIGVISSLFIGIGQYAFSQTLQHVSYNFAWFIIFGFGFALLLIFPFYLSMDHKRYPKLYS